MHEPAVPDDRAAVAAVGGQVARHAPRPEAGADLLERPELDRRAERVADGAGQQAAADPVAGRHPGQTYGVVVVSVANPSRSNSGRLVSSASACR